MKYVISILNFVLIMFLSSCDLFTTRNAETPDQPRDDFQPPLEPAAVIQNLIFAFKDKNVENYLSCFADSSFAGRSFRFSPSSGATLNYPFLAEDWSKKDEEQYFRNLIQKIPADFPASLSFSNVSSSPQGDSLIYTATYSINLPNDGSIPENYLGDLKFSMIRDSRSFWVVYFWQDIKNPDFPSWSEMKGRNY
ncbi:MAG: hypothetical protein HXY49_03410 [Ignavibacteriaceae bacterium]|nr:hypothetical protein [Ignavibacteriaceae bacterium]